jgi:hypothetical protein
MRVAIDSRESAGVDGGGMDDRRQYPRHPVGSLVYGKVRSIVSVRIVDVSKGGLQLELSTSLRPGTTCEVTLPTMSGTVQLRAAVRRCRARSVTTEEGLRLLYYAGLQFCDPTEEERRALESGLDTSRSTSLEVAPGTEPGWGRGRPS